MKITKSSRHTKIAGDFGENLVLYWLSKYGCECARIDHTGIDIIARNPTTNEVMGISVKSRTRNEGTENEHVNVGARSIAKAEAACRAFNCVPYLAVVVDAGTTIRGFITSMKHLEEMGMTSGWRMGPESLKRYDLDEHIVKFTMTTDILNWWK